MKLLVVIIKFIYLKLKSNKNFCGWNFHNPSIFEEGDIYSFEIFHFWAKILNILCEKF